MRNFFFSINLCRALRKYEAKNRLPIEEIFVLPLGRVNMETCTIENFKLVQKTLVWKESLLSVMMQRLVLLSKLHIRNIPVELFKTWANGRSCGSRFLRCQLLDAFWSDDECTPRIMWRVWGHRGGGRVEEAIRSFGRILLLVLHRFFCILFGLFFVQNRMGPRPVMRSFSSPVTPTLCHASAYPSESMAERVKGLYH